ncbi:hypothetical protein JXO52_01650 [bacterium]|nr:hypothetical protein [bacterium]
MKYRLQLLSLVMIIGVISTLLHEAGHCLFYRVQGIPAGMSLVMEFPLIDITAKQYGIGSFGGPLVNVLLVIFGYYFVRKYEKKSRQWTIFSAILLANAFYLIFRSILGVAKHDGGEIESMMNLVGLNFYPAAFLFLILALLILVSWIRMFKIKISLGNISYFVLLFVSYLVAIILMEAIDTNYFWKKFPTITIEDVRTHNPHH